MLDPVKIPNGVQGFSSRHFPNCSQPVSPPPFSHPDGPPQPNQEPSGASGSEDADGKRSGGLEEPRVSSEVCMGVHTHPPGLRTLACVLPDPRTHGMKGVQTGSSPSTIVRGVFSETPASFRRTLFRSSWSRGTASLQHSTPSSSAGPHCQHPSWKAPSPSLFPFVKANAGLLSSLEVSNPF